MQGKQVLNETLFVYNLSIETFVPEIERHQEKVREKSDRNEPNQKRLV